MIILFLVTVIDLVGFSLIFPLLPSLKMAYLLSDLEVGYLASIFAVFALFGNICFGILSDKIGRKFIIAIPAILAGIVYILTPYAETYIGLLFYRALSGFLTGNFVVAFASASDISTDKTRFRNMATIGIAFSFGFIMGPVLGGLVAGDSNNLEEININGTFLIAGLVSIVAGILALFMLKESLSKKDREVKNNLNILGSLKVIYSNKVMILMTYLTILVSFFFAGSEAYLSLWLHSIFDFTARYVGFYWAFFALIIASAQFSAPVFFNHRQSLVIGFILFTASQFLLAFSDTYTLLIIATVLMAFGLGTIFPSINANLALQGSKNQQGLVFGINQSFGSLGRIIGPYFMGLVYQVNLHYTWFLTGVLGAFTVIIIIIFIPYLPIKRSAKKVIDSNE